jgi:isochorismate synthase
MARARRRRGPVWVSAKLDTPVAPSLSVAADQVVWALRGPGGDQTVGLGAARVFSGRGADAWRAVHAALRTFQDAVHLDGALTLGGGAAFDPGSGRWPGFPDAAMVLPQLVCRWHTGGSAEWRAALHLDPDDAVDAVVRRLAGMARAPGGPSVAPRLSATRAVPPPSRWRSDVATLVEALRRGHAEKVVLARAVDLAFSAPLDVDAVFGRLAQDPSAAVFLVRQPGGVFLGATPELLARVSGRQVDIPAVAGTQAAALDPRSLLESAKDRHEHAVVADYIRRQLERVAVSVGAGPVRVDTAGPVAHLVTPLHGQLRTGFGLADVVGAMAPTPAVGGAPTRAALEWQRRLEAMPRGWYAGTVGTMRLDGDGAFYVALRSARIRGRRARLYAGCGIMRDSDPGAELWESTQKLSVMMKALVGTVEQ